CVLAISVTGLTAMLIQGCKRTAPETESDLNPPPLDTNAFPAADTNFPPMTSVSNPPVEPLPPVVPNPPVTPMSAPPVTPASVAPLAPAAGSEYTVVKGDTLGKIAKSHGVSTKAIETANPTVVPTRLQIGQKLVIPAGTPAAVGASAATMSANPGETIYTVKSGDTLSRIARHYNTTIKAIQSANNLITTKIRVGQKLRIPAKAEEAPVMPAPAPAPAPAPISDPAPAGLPPVPAPASATGR
ncbi:MAG TPA: LysM peptidoglycan-binding domain-containing protein, partial [Candidatus Binatia bacterium]|nr:LysM peptidoglycan-binding domain-containing protein [Candidatus Binatia bacterium]